MMYEIAWIKGAQHFYVEGEEVSQKVYVEFVDIRNELNRWEEAARLTDEYVASATEPEAICIYWAPGWSLYDVAHADDPTWMKPYDAEKHIERITIIENKSTTTDSTYHAMCSKCKCTIVSTTLARDFAVMCVGEHLVVNHGIDYGEPTGACGVLGGAMKYVIVDEVRTQEAV